MFTGIVTAIGEIIANDLLPDGRELRIRASLRRIGLGESIAVHGACLTVTGKGRGWFGVTATPTTLERTRFGELLPGDKVNLERAAKLGDSLGGHLVQGHVDGLGVVTGVAERPGARLLDLKVPDSVARATMPLGSVTLDGVSLTVNAIAAPGIIQVALIPYTLAHTTLGELAVGDRVHVEGDVIGKYVRTFLDSGPDYVIRHG
jgi:riboflavin synthase